MIRPRVIPVLLCDHVGSLVKTRGFKDPKYVGDPINAVRIFNDKEVDELIFLDISATKEKRRPNFDYLQQVASEAFMPLCYGGGIQTMEDIALVIKAGIEKVAINTSASKKPELVKQCAEKFGSSATVVSVDIDKDFWGKQRIWVQNGKKKLDIPPLEYIKKMEEMGAGEILLNSIDRDGKMEGFDLDTIKKISKEISIPLIVCGGAGNLEHLRLAIENGASAAAAGSIFVFHGKHRGVLISYPTNKELSKLYSK